MADEITYRYRVYRKFPRMDGLKDLYRAPDNHVFSERSLEMKPWRVPEGKPKKNLYCGWKLIKSPKKGFYWHSGSPCAAFDLVVFMSLSQSGDGGNFIRHRGSTAQLAPLIGLSPGFYNKRDNTWKFLRISKKPWASSEKLEKEMGGRRNATRGSGPWLTVLRPGLSVSVRLKRITRIRSKKLQSQRLRSILIGDSFSEIRLRDAIHRSRRAQDYLTQFEVIESFGWGPQRHTLERLARMINNEMGLHGQTGRGDRTHLGQSRFFPHISRSP
ncbi:hypothetical protein DAPPUDRAFT_110875 [Daphnia pulex]|uniref:Uncharacterized protein n=1 Tax=Daphnia pulex TaxID=6669 RepID=E9H7F0_DAPPU|nr:hypothetical protein DAPPUDRAFT_110875 [Daphnia pulex]|eukprot:EFX72377.1 hypothetical protein DAPPUDRAFT_110875 [Daphnia pulex]